MKSVSPTFDCWEEHQLSLPRLPLPDLNVTMAKYLESLKHLLSDEDYNIAERDASAFLENEGRSLHAELKERNRMSTLQQLNTSWCRPFWDKMYLSGRYPVPINSNPFFHLKPDPVHGTSQAKRAASLVCAYAQLYCAISDGRVSPDTRGRNTPLCMDEYSRLFACSRIPKSGEDSWRCSPGSRHITILRGNGIYSMDIVGNDGVYHQHTIEHAIESFLLKTRNAPNDKDFLGHMCSTDRDTWAKARANLVQEDPVNERSLDRIDSSLFVLALDFESARTLDEEMWYGLHGGGERRHRWFDKSFNLCVCPNGEAVVNFEHSMFDGSVILRMLDDAWHVMNGMAPKIGKPFQYKWCHPRSSLAPVKLKWNFSAATTAAIRSARLGHNEQAQNVRLACLEFQSYGAGQLKRWGLSPDATAQVCFQWAYAKLNPSDRFVFCYEPAATKPFLCGRTEVIRASTAESKQFVEYMTAQGDGPFSPDAAVKLLKRACAKHRGTAKAASMGQGVDRHLFALFNISRQRGGPLPKVFQNKAWEVSNTSIISTSHVPSEGIQGLGFGPVVSNGYGIAYEVLGDRIIATFSNFAKVGNTGGGGFGGVKRKAGDRPARIATDCVSFRAAFEECLTTISGLFEEKNVGTAGRGRL
jgi:hypothetical protein